MATVSTGLLQRLNLLLGATERTELLAILDAHSAQTPSMRLRTKFALLLSEKLAADELMAILGGNEANVSVRLRQRLRLAFADEPHADEFIALLEAIDITTEPPTTTPPTTLVPTTPSLMKATPTTGS